MAGISGLGNAGKQVNNPGRFERAPFEPSRIEPSRFEPANKGDKSDKGANGPNKGDGAGREAREGARKLG